MHPTGPELDARPAKREKKKAHFFVSSTGVSPALQPHSTVDSHGHESTLTPGTSSASASTGGSSSRRHSHGNTLAPLSHYGAPEASNDVVSHSVYDEDVDIAHSLSSYSTLASQSSSSLFHPLTRTTRRSRSSLAALRNALQEYQVPLDSEEDAPLSPSPRSPRTPPRPGYAEEPIYTNATAGGMPYGVEYRDAFGRVRRRDMTMSAQTSGYDLSQRRDFHRYQSVSTLDLRALGSRSALEYGSPGPERMDALVDIHRVLYRGSEGRTHASTFAAQGVEVKRVIERWFEQDCVYDHPLVNVVSRSAFLAHFAFLHLISTGYVPKVTPSALLQHVSRVTSIARQRLIGLDDHGGDIEAASEGKSLKGKNKSSEEWLGYGARQDTQMVMRDGARTSDSAWWKIWDVTADCTDIGGMECYDGYHLALIEHVITLTLFPTLLRPRIDPYEPASLPSSIASSPRSLELPLPTSAIRAPSFIRRLAAAVADELEYLLHWDLPISTMVYFNEVGKATHVRDVIDVQDAIETFVPFAKRLSWLTRRLTGLTTSVLGFAAMALVPGPKVQVNEAIRVAASSGAAAEKVRSGTEIGLGLELGSDSERDEAYLMGYDTQLGPPIGLSNQHNSSSSDFAIKYPSVPGPRRLRQRSYGSNPSDLSIDSSAEEQDRLGPSGRDGGSDVKQAKGMEGCRWEERNLLGLELEGSREEPDCIPESG